MALLWIKVLCLSFLISLLVFGIKGIAEYKTPIDSHSNQTKNCFAGFPDAISHLSTKTPYFPPLASEEVESPHLEGCEAKRIWIISRHGTRNPSTDIIQRMKTELPTIQAEITANAKGLCEETFANIKNWKVRADLHESEEEFLVPQGRKEMAGLALRFKEKFPSLFNHSYDNSTFKFQYTKTERAESSAKAFVSALFGEAIEKNVSYPTPDAEDQVLRFYKTCTKWKTEVDKNPQTLTEMKLFEESKYFEALALNVQTRLGFQRNLTLDEIELVYLTCGYESAWNPDELSPWCAVFDESDFKVLEYREDLESYWKNGYGHEITYEQACPLVKDFVHAFQNKIDDPNSPSVTAYFTHSGAIVKFITRLGLFKDKQPLRSENYMLEHDRKWRLSKIDKFGSNLALLLHQCGEEYLISAYYQETLVRLPVCNKMSCTFSEFKTKVSDIVNNCDLKSLCKS